MLFAGDQVAFYVDRNRKTEGISGIALNTIILVHAKPSKVDSNGSRLKSDKTKDKNVSKILFCIKCYHFNLLLL